jgi:hypothetical protein
MGKVSLKGCSLIVLISIVAPAQSNAAPDQTRIFMKPSCPVSGSIPNESGAFAPFLLPIVSAIIGPAVKGIVDAASSAIQEAAKDQDNTWPPPPPFTGNYYQIGPAGDTYLNPENACIVIASGVFGAHDSAHPRPVGTTLVNTIQQQFSGQTLQDRLQSVSFYLEVAVIPGEEKGYFGLRPQLAYVGKFNASSGPFGSSKRNFRVALSLRDIPDGKPFASTTVLIPELKAGSGFIDCEGVKPTAPCPHYNLGGVVGWYGTKPDDAEVKAKADGQAAVAATLSRAVALAVKVDSPMPEDKPDTQKALIAYCADIDRSNAATKREHLLDDAACPESVTRLKRVYLSARSDDLAKINKEAALAKWNALCGPKDGQPAFPQTAEGAAQCLRTRFKPQNLGSFDVAVTIVEVRPGNPLAKALAPVVSAAAPKIEDAITQNIDPAAKAKSSASDAAAKLGSSQAAKVAYAQEQVQESVFNAAQQAYAVGQNDMTQQAMLTAKVALIQAQQAANNAYLKAGLAIPFPRAD